MKVFVMTFDEGIVYDEVDDNTKDFLEDWPTICNVHVHHNRNNEIKHHKFSLMRWKTRSWVTYVKQLNCLPLGDCEA